MLHLLGEYEVAIDTKGRFLVPSGFRKQLPEGEADKFVINRGFESCLTLYLMSVWQELSEKISKINDFNPKARDFKRLFLNGATIVELDSADRFLLPKHLQEFANIKKNIVFSAQVNKVELWDKDIYHNYINSRKDDYSQLAEDVLGGSFNPFENL